MFLMRSLKAFRVYDGKVVDFSYVKSDKSIRVGVYHSERVFQYGSYGICVEQ